MRSGLSLLVALLVVALSACASPRLPGDPQPVEPWDFLLKGARVVDGTGTAWQYADVAIRGDRVDRVAPPGTLPRERAREVLELDGMVLAPGFIDLNGQSDLRYLSDGSALSKIFQGVTTEIMGESNSPAPVNDLVLGQVDPADTTAVRRAREWTRFGAWLQEMEAGGVAVNVGSFVGGTTVRRYAMGSREGPPSHAQLDTMRAVTARSMEEGAFGVATALIYPPGAYAGTEELVEISRVVAEYGGVYITHMRNESFRILEALDEAIRIGEASGAPVEIYHLKLAGVENWDATEEVLDRIQSARNRGVDVSAGMYPYTAGSTGLTACFPPWTQADDRLEENLRDPETRARIRDEALGPPGDWENWCRLATPEGSVVASVSRSEHRDYVGMTLAEVTEAMGRESWVDAAMDLVLADESRVGMVYFAMSEENVRRKLTLPYMKFGTDGGGWNPETATGQPHPRAYGTYPRILGRYVRDEGVLGLEEAIMKSTWAVARRIGLRDRGLVAEGFHADLVVLDLEALEERATFDEPHQLAVGVEHLWVNGIPVIRDGEYTGARPGRFVRGPGSVTQDEGRSGSGPGTARQGDPGRE